MSTTHKLYGERINPSKQQLKRKLRQATVADGFQMKPGFLYTVVRAISARVNQNYDGWPSDELKKSYHTFIGKPVFVNHENYDPKTARGVVVAARYIENGRDKYVEVIQEIDAPRFPLLAHEIRTGGLDSVSMGAEAGFTICSVCDNKAVDERDMCQHVMFHKGEMLPRRNHKTGKMERVLCYESCHKLGFFELSYVFDPADETAVASKVLMASKDTGQTRQAALEWQDHPTHSVAYHPDGYEYTVHPDGDGGAHDVFRMDPNGDSWHISPANSRDEGKMLAELDDPSIRMAGKYTKEDFAIQDGKKPWEREVADPDLEDAVVTAFRRGPLRIADNECLPGEDCDSGTAGPSGDTVKSDPNLQPLTPGAGSGGGSSSAPAAGTSAPIGTDGGSSSGAPPVSGNGSIPIIHNPDGTISSPDPAWKHLIDRESGGRNVTQQITDSNSGGNEAQGFFQITPQTWKSNGGAAFAPNPEAATAEQQAEVAKNIFNKNPSGSDWGAGMSGREDAGALARGIGSPASPSQMPKAAAFERRVLTAAGFKQIRKAWGETEAPVRIDTLREEGSAPEDDSDDFYHFVESPRELRTPDLSQAGDIDREQSAEGQGAEDLPEAGGEGGDDGGQYITLKIPVPPQSQSDVLPSQPFDAGPAPAPPGPQEGPPPGAMPPPGPEGPPPSGMPPGPPVSPEQQQIAASTLDYFNRYFGRRVANWYDAVAQGREMTAAERADYQLQASTLRNAPVVSTTSRTPKEGTANMGRSTLAERGKTASRGRRQHFAEGPLTDGGDVSRNDQGEQEEAFISETPPEESVVAPTDDTPNISNTENNLVARVQLGQQQLLRDAQALAALRARQGSRRHAEEMTEAGGPVSTTVDPALSGTDDQSLKGDDFQSANPNDGAVATNPHDASLNKFKVFDNWLSRKTGKSSNQHTAATIRRYAEHYANATNTPIQAYFPALGIVLREARKNEKAVPAKRKATTAKGAKMRKRADEKLEVAAPDGRVDVEAPVSNTTDAEAQASQFDTGDFGNNAGDDIAKPDLSTDQNFAPGEANKTGRAKTAGELLGIQCAEAMIEAGLEPNDRKRKYALAAEFGRMNRGLILDRIALAERFASVLNQTHAHYARKVASGGTRGTTRSPLPPGMSGGAPRQMTAGTRRTAANDPSNDSLMFG